MGTGAWKAVAAGALLPLWLAGVAAAQQPAPADAQRRVEFGVERETEIENDRATAVLTATAEDEDAAEVAERLNEAMAWALEQAGEVEPVRARSGDYRTFPMTDEAKIRRWRGQQELVLETQDLPALTRLIGVLQGRLQLQSIAFAASPARRREAEARLIGDALAAFRARAELVREALGAGGYELVHVAIDTGGAEPPPRPYFAESRAMAADVSPPAFEEGTSTVRVGVRGTIELQ